MFSKVLVANRGEIAIRVMRTLREMGIASVAVYSEADREALHVRRADEAFLLGPGPAAESYLKIDKLIEVAKESRAEAIHPGYGFLAENPNLARACDDAGIVWIGPPAKAIEAMGSKTGAREIMKTAGIPIIPGTTEPVPDVDSAKQVIDSEIGYPVAIKAVGGGGGKGFRVALDESELQSAFEGAAREGEKFFGDPTVYIERYLPDPRHVELQVLADSHGNVIHLGERDCSLQRRHQKLIEESPAPAVSDELRAKIGQIAADAAKAVDYRSAGTFEGLLQDDEWFFMEMNTRVQVEHCVTEMVTGVDIVREQILIAAGEPLSLSQDDVRFYGHAIECRINAEDASKNFAPAPGAITSYREPAGPGVRMDSGVEAGAEITPLYDPMVAKLIVWDVDREHATRRAIRALGELEVGGVRTLIPFHTAILDTEQWANAETCRDLIEDREWLKTLAQPKPEAPPEGQDEAAKVERKYAVEVSGKLFEVKVIGEALGGPVANGAAATAAAKKPKRRERSGGGTGGGGSADGRLISPLQGTVLKVNVENGAQVEAGALICVIEAMKMENEITAPAGGTVEELGVSEGAAISTGDTIAVIK
ncbi:MAG TPA: acetyl-CoA carboxylase biotin carboxylase subunit [Thermoleophilaceae bacterium]|nr:acetyl-CoA carboxylase biotin carboxylase subunit [Thermoleophilaceae bacterium]